MDQVKVDEERDYLSAHQPYHQSHHQSHQDQVKELLELYLLLMYDYQN